jgi:hypothetical protein
MITSERVEDLKRRRELAEALLLALVPVGMALVLGVLLLPRHASPEMVPLPVADPQALARVATTDHELAERARREALPGPVRALGSALRDFHGLEARSTETKDLYDSRRKVDAALADAVPGGPGPLLELRAVQLEGFLDEIERFESTGEQSPELLALAGGFVRTLAAEGWADGRSLAPGRDALRAMFKQMWVSFLHLEETPELSPTLDEQRTLYAFYLSHAHPSRAAREAIAAARRGARDARSCAAIEASEQAAVEAWRLEHIVKLAALDPSYPADYARGIASYRKGDFRASAKAFRAWLMEHPDGPLALRAQNYLRSAANAESVE